MKQGTQIALLSSLFGSAITIAALWAFQLHTMPNPGRSSNASIVGEASAAAYPDSRLHVEEIEKRHNAVYVHQGGDLTAYDVVHHQEAENVSGDLHRPKLLLEEQPLVLPVKFFGYGNVPFSSARRAFFEDGEEVHIVSEGDTLLGRFRILKINNASIDFEEVGSGRRGQKMLEDQGPA